LNLLCSLQAPPAWRRLAFVSDLHLGPDTAATQAAFAAWLAREPADALFILGDLFESWVGDDAQQLPYAAELAGSLRRFARPIYFQHGNRDFLLRDFAGLQLLAEHCVLQAFGQQVLLAHGDAHCLDDVPYQAFRTQVRNPVWQTAFLQRPLAERLQLAAQMRDASQRAQGETRAQGLPFADPDTEACRALLQQTGCEMLVHGHTHRPGLFALGGSYNRCVLSDWDFESSPPRGDCLVWSASGWQREAVWA
jgi:UDP-2,3-diacylglucosamine hydrolase